MKALTFLLVLSSTGLGAWAWWEHATRVSLERNFSTVSGERDRYKKSAQESMGMFAGKDLKKEGPTGLDEQLKDLGLKLEDLDPDKKKSKERPDLKAPGEKSLEPDRPSLAKTLQDPSERLLLRAQAGAQLELVYGDFLKSMGLDDNRRAEVLSILKNRQGSQTDLRLEVFDATLSAGERKAAAEKMTQTTAEAEGKLKAVLGADYAKLEKFEKSAPEREHLTLLKSLLKEKDIALEESTETKLMDTLFAGRQAYQFDVDLSDLNNVQPSNLTDAVVDRYLEQYASLQVQLQPQVKPILSEEQYGVFLKAQEDQQHAAEMHIQWMRQFTGRGRGNDARD